jgi:hypothetical protein
MNQGNIDDDEEDMGIDQSYANGDKIMKNQLNSLYGQLEGMMAYHWMNYLNISAQAKIQHKLNHESEKRVFDDDFFALFVLFSKFSFPHFDDIVTFLLQESADL